MKRTVLSGVLISAAVLAASVAAAGGGNYSYTFNSADQLTHVYSGGAAVADFTYDGDNLRMTKHGSAGDTVYVRGASGEVLAEYDNLGNLIAEYVYLDGQRVCKITTDAQGVEHRTYYHADLVGTPLALTDENGAEIARGEYLPFGGDAPGNSIAEPHKFTGKELDSEFGLYYFEARYYNADLGRFISVDPVGGSNGDPQSWNRYSYVRNNPIKLVDPDGRMDSFHRAISDLHTMEVLRQNSTPQQMLEVKQTIQAGRAQIIGGTFAAFMAMVTAGESFGLNIVMGGVWNAYGGILTRSLDGDRSTEVFDTWAIGKDFAFGTVGTVGTDYAFGKKALETAIDNALGAGGARIASEMTSNTFTLFGPEALGAATDALKSEGSIDPNTSDNEVVERPVVPESLIHVVSR